jgi:multiple sugar transport system permease protein
MTQVQKVFPVKPKPRPTQDSQLTAKISAYAILGVMCFFTFIPFYFMFVFSTWDKTQIYTLPIHTWFGPDFGVNYQVLLEKVPFWKGFWNSTYIALIGTITGVFFAALGGFGFSMYEFKYKNILFSLLLGSMLIPTVMGIIPFYLIMQALGWIGTPRALWVPGIAAPTGIFLMRQYMSSAIPKELVEAARIDGASEINVFIRIILPLVTPISATFGLTTFIYHWNSVIGPTIILKDRDSFTIPMILRSLQGTSTSETGAMIAGLVIAVVPMLIAFIFTSRNLVAGLSAGAVKG